MSAPLEPPSPVVPPGPSPTSPPSPCVEHTSWRTRKLYAEEGWDDKSTRANRKASPLPHLIVVGIALVIVGFWLVSSRETRTFPVIWVLLGGVHGLTAIYKARRNRRTRDAGTEVAKVFD